MELYFIKLYVKLYINNLEDRQHILDLAAKQGITDEDKINVFIHNFRYNEINKYSSYFIELIKSYERLSANELFERYAEGYRNYSLVFGANVKFIERHKDNIVKEIRNRIKLIMENI